MFDDHVAVGHAGEVIAYGAVQTDLFDAFLGTGSQLAGVEQAIFEQFPQHLHGMHVRLVNDGIVIKIFVEIFAQLQIELVALRTVAD